MSEREPGPPPGDGEWAFLIEDPDATCAICGEAIGPAQAVGHVDDGLVHAKCYDGQQRAA